MNYLSIFYQTSVNALENFWYSITFQNGLWGNYFWYLIFISAFIYCLEILFPWRKNQPYIRKYFWVDIFYMFFNFFLFGIILFFGISEVAVNLFNSLLHHFGIENIVALNLNKQPLLLQYFTLFIVVDFFSWLIHILLHRISFLWEFHKIHHSTVQMGFAAHLRYSWMENIVYKSILFVPISMIGFEIDDFFAVHMLTIAIGHWNHANFNLNIGPLKYIFNNPAMHIWHHAKNLPENKKYGINFGISLSLWDYIFNTNYIPKSGKDIALGYEGMEKYPNGFLKQLLVGFIKFNKK